MKQLLFLLIFCTVTQLAIAQKSTWQVDKAHSSVRFTIKHLIISDVEGTFKTFNGTVKSAKPDFTDAEVDFTVAITSVDTDNETRDKQLQTADYFDSGNYPDMVFKSTAIRKTKGSYYKLEGNLTIRGITQKVVFAVIYGGTVKDENGNTKAGFRASTTINRNDFKVSGGKQAVGEDVAITINVELQQLKPSTTSMN